LNSFKDIAYQILKKADKPPYSKESSKIAKKNTIKNLRSLGRISMKEKNEEALKLTEEILKNIELDEIPLRNVALKCARLGRLTNNQSAMDLFRYELAGYPQGDGGLILTEAFNLARYVNRVFKQKDKVGVLREYIFPETVAELETETDAAKEQMKVSSDRDVSVASSNPGQYVMAPIGNSFERFGLRQTITEKSKKLNKLKSGYYNYALGVYYELKFGDIVEEIFEKRRKSVNKYLSEKLPETLKKLVSVYENLRSKSEEDWANAVHSCRRVIKDVADLFYPADNSEIDIGSGKKIRLSEEKYIMRLKQYIKNKSGSKRFNEIVGSHLDYIGDRIDAIHNASTKGSHADIKREEAERYMIYAYLLISDLITL